MKRVNRSTKGIKREGERFVVNSAVEVASQHAASKRGTAALASA